VIRLYNLLLLLATPLWAGYFLWRILNGSWRNRWWERLGLLPIQPDPSRERIWLHAVSVGEVLAALPVLKRLREAFPEHEIVLSTTTPTGQQTAHDSAHQWVDYILFFPLDLPFAVRRALHRISPRILLLMETELWYNLLYQHKRQGGATLILNGRLSDHSFQRAQRWKRFFRPMLEQVDFACVQSPTDAVRFVELGLSPSRVAVTGNTKFDQALDATDTSPEFWRKALHLPFGAPVIVVGSTRAPEEEQLVLEAYQRVCEQIAGVCLIFAPRHLGRVPEVETAMQGKGLEPVRRTALQNGTFEPTGNSTPVIIVDTYGELARLYSVATVVVIGGGFAPMGGQNMFQPMAHGKPVFFGPHMQNFRDIALIAKNEGIGFEVDSAEELASGIIRLLKDPAQCLEIDRKARTLIEIHQGASERCVQSVATWMTNVQNQNALTFRGGKRYNNPDREV
jgi:3-deoxy-D-manno-octulosonic-acid transferase